MLRSHDLADKETVMGLFDTQCLLNYLARNFSRFKCALVKCEIARDGETLLYDLQVNNIVIITSVYTPYFKNDDRVELHWLEHLWNHKKSSRQG